MRTARKSCSTMTNAAFRGLGEHMPIPTQSLRALRGGIACVLIAAACSASIESPNIARDFHETATASIAPFNGRSVYAILTVENIGALQQSMSWGVDCAGAGALLVKAYRQVGTAQVLAWNSASLPRTLGCPTQLVSRALNPGDQLTLQQTIPVATILGDSLPAGPYTLTVAALTTPTLDSVIAVGSLVLTTAVIDPPGSSLNGTWTASSHGVDLTLTLAWSADSVLGSGTYTSSDSNSLGCGGGTLRGTGAVKLVAHRAHDQFQGVMSFDNGWVPPYAAVLVDASTLGGAFSSVDAGPCPLTLTQR
jgi:hypothetical protein